MKKLLLPLLVLGSLSASATSYDYSEKIETHCTSAAGAPVSFSGTVQHEGKVGWDGYIQSTLSTASVKVVGKIDGQRINIGNTINITTNSKERISNAVESSVGIENNGVVTKSLSTLTGDETTPGQSVKISMTGAVSGFGDRVATANIVHSNGVGFVSLSIEDEHYETIAVKCTSLRDTADNDQEYIADFQ
jgi:hypothetical protein